MWDQRAAPGVGMSVGTKVQIQQLTPPNGNGQQTEQRKQSWWQALIATYRKKLINVKTMSRSQRLIFGAVIAQLSLVAALFAVQNAPLPRFTIGGATTIPAPTFILTALALTFAASFIVTGALHGHWTLRLVVLVLFSISTIYFPLVSILNAGTQDIFLVAAVAMQCGAILLIWVWGLVIALVSRRIRRGVAPTSARVTPGLTYGIVLVALIIYWFPYLLPGNVGGFLALVPQVVDTQVALLSLLIIPALILAGTDFVETAHAVTEQIAAFVERARISWPLALLTALLCIAIPGVLLVQLKPSAAQQEKFFIGLGLAALAQLVALALLLAIVLLGRVWRWPTAEIGLSALVFAALIFGGILFVGLPAVSVWTQHQQVVTSAQSLAVFQLPTAIAGLALGIPLLLRGRRKVGALAIAGLFFAIVGVQEAVDIALLLVSPWSGWEIRIAGLQIVLALATLVTLFVLVISCRLQRATPLVAILFALNGTLAAVSWVYSNYKIGPSVARPFTILQGLLLVGTFVWDYLTSGQSVTNLNGRRFPRYVRLLVYSGYTILITALLLYLSSTAASSVDSAKALADNNSSFWTNIGLGLLGIPLFLATFTLLITRWWGSRNSQNS